MFINAALFYHAYLDKSQQFLNIFSNRTFLVLLFPSLEVVLLSSVTLRREKISFQFIFAGRKRIGGGDFSPKKVSVFAPMGILEKQVAR